LIPTPHAARQHLAHDTAGAGAEQHLRMAGSWSSPSAGVNINPQQSQAGSKPAAINDANHFRRGLNSITSRGQDAAESLRANLQRFHEWWDGLLIFFFTVYFVLHEFLSPSPISQSTMFQIWNRWSVSMDVGKMT